MAALGQLIIASLDAGITYAMLGLTLVLLFKTTNVLNFAQGTISALGGYLVYLATASWGFPWVLGAVAGVAIPTAGIVAVERLVIRRLIGRGLLAIAIVMVGFDLLLRNVTRLVFGAQTLPATAPISGVLQVGPLRLPWYSLLVVVVGAAALAVTAWLVNRTELGLAMRAFAQDGVAANLMGIPHGRVSRAAWMLTTALGALTGVLLAPILFLHLGYMDGAFVKGLAAAILGGFHSLGGAVAGGLVIGLLEGLAIKYAPSSISAMLPFLVVLGVLLMRPQGLFTFTRSIARA